MNKVISREYVEKNYIHRNVIEKHLKIAIENNELNPYDLSETNGKVIRCLKLILEETKDVNK